MSRNLIRAALALPLVFAASACDDMNNDRIDVDEDRFGDERRRHEGIDHDVKKEGDNPFKVDDRMEWQKAVDRKLDDIDERIEGLRNDGDLGAEDLREITALETAASSAREDLARVTASTDDGWEALGRDLDTTIEALDDRIDVVRARINDDDPEVDGVDRREFDAPDDVDGVDEPLDGEPGR